MNSVKLNTDASVSMGGAFGGGLVRSVKGNLVFVFYKGFGEYDVITAEALALLAGLRLCQHRNVTRFMAEMDSSMLGSMVASKGASR